MKEIKSIKQFTDKDLDGMGCRIVLEELFKNKEIDVTHVSANYVEKEVLNFLKSEDKDSFDMVVITDLSVSKETVIKLEESFKDNLMIIDHHKTSLYLNEFESKNILSIPEIHGVKTSATSLLYNLYLKNNVSEQYKEIIEEFVELVRLFDTWDWKINDVEKANDLNNLYYKLGLVRFYKTIKNNMFSTPEPTIFTEKEDIIIEMEHIAYKRFLKRSIKQLNIEEVQIGDFQYKYGFLLNSDYVSVLGNDILKEVEEIDFIIMASTNGKVSLRSRENVDVSIIAKAFFNGGGHPQASGGKVEIDLKEYMRLEILNSFK